MTPTMSAAVASRQAIAATTKAVDALTLRMRK